MFGMRKLWSKQVSKIKKQERVRIANILAKNNIQIPPKAILEIMEK